MSWSMNLRKEANFQFFKSGWEIEFPKTFKLLPFIMLWLKLKLILIKTHNNFLQLINSTTQESLVNSARTEILIYQWSPTQETLVNAMNNWLIAPIDTPSSVFKLNIWSKDNLNNFGSLSFLMKMSIEKKLLIKLLQLNFLKAKTLNKLSLLFNHLWKLNSQLSSWPF